MKKSEWFPGVYEEFMELYDFARCQRPDGSYYGTGGQCRKGTPAGAKQAEPKKSKKKSTPKAESAPAPAKKGGYTPRDAKGATGVKPKLKEDMFKNKSSSFDTKTMDERIARVKANKNYSAAHRKELMARLEKEKSQIASNMKFAENVGKNLPKGTKLEVTGTGTVKITTTTKAGDKVASTYSPRMGYEFRVNGNLDTGKAKNGIQAAQATRVQFDALVKALPTGHIMKTSAYTDDGNGAARQKAYEKVGFSKGKPGKDLFAVKQADGSVAPGKSGKAGLSKQKAQDKANELWFKEAEDMDKVWYTILTGEDFKG